MNDEQRLAPGTLWPLIQRRQREALASGALQPIATTQEFVEDGGIRFLIRIAANLARKEADRVRQTEQNRSGEPPVNPFLPYEDALFVAELSATHLALLNKFNIIDHHLLIVTRRFAHQETLLDLADFRALCLGLAEREGLGFYNGGAVAGASQPHKHLQLVPLPLVDSIPGIPFDALLRNARCGASVETVPGLPFRHAFAALDPALAMQPLAFAEALHERYRALLRKLGIDAVRVDGELRQSEPYNLLVTRDWLLLVPRRREDFEGISINALGFAGSLFVENRAQLDTLKNRGPMAALRAVTRSGQTTAGDTASDLSERELPSKMR
ncbi:MAG TPA: phosphorylase [Candidatus Competibacter sp.]|nr:phosphorylase [Candidatus Competibacter sp.]